MVVTVSKYPGPLSGALGHLMGSTLCREAYTGIKLSSAGLVTGLNMSQGQNSL